MEQYTIVTDDNVFQFDPCEDDYQRALSPCGTNTAAPFGNAATMPSHDGPLSPGELGMGDSSPSSSSKGKGKSPAMPVPIPYTTGRNNAFDNSLSKAQMSPASSSRFSPSALSSFGLTSFAFSPASSSISSYGTTLSSPMSEVMDVDKVPSPSRSVWKGKAADTPPTLPPLSFGTSDRDDGHLDWMSFGQSSPAYSPPPQSSTGALSPPLAALSTGIASRSSIPLLSFEQDGASANQSGPPISPTRRNSLSSLSIASELTLRKVKVPPPYPPQGFIARKLAFGKGTPSPSRPTSLSAISPEILHYDYSAGKGLKVWYTTPKPDGPSVSHTPALTQSTNPEPLLPAPKLLRHKGRSHSEPVPFSALDLVPAASSDIFEPLPLFIRNHFDESLPREIHLHILRCFVQNHIDDHRRLVESHRWSASKAASSKNQCLGKEKGIRELLKLACVAKSWCNAVFDGQLWTDLDLHGFPRIPLHIVKRITESGGPFIQTLDLSGHVLFTPENLIDIADKFCLPIPGEIVSHTQLTSISLRGCKNLTTRSLHHLLLRSGSLERLNLKGLGCVTNTTCEILATYCPRLVSLNLSQCPNMGATGIRFMANAVHARKDRLQLVELRLAGLKYATDSMMESLGRAAPLLEILDLSYARQLHNSALEAFVAYEEDEEIDELVETVTVTARDLGRDPGEYGPILYKRRVTRLRHLNLSFCVLLTDTACANLSYSVPKLEILEMAGIGPHLKDDGLIRLLERTPLIKRLDLEDAMDVTDSLLATITPPPAKPTSPSESDPSFQPHTGHALQHLVLSYAVLLTDVAFLKLIRNCTKLVGLEADNTRIGHSVVREFVRLSKARKATDARIVAVDCRGIGEGLTKELSPFTRPRLGWRNYEARRLHYIDGRDGGAGAEEDMKVGGGQDECDEKRVVLKTFYGWQTVDVVKANREKRRSAKSAGSGSGSGRRNEGRGGREDEDARGNRRGSGTRWWTPGGRRSGSSSPPIMTDIPNDGCRTM